MNTKKLIQEFERVRDLPYRIPLKYEEEDLCCLGKHKMLKKIYEGMGYECRYRIAMFKWSSMDLPEKVSKEPHVDDCAHLYLEIKIDGRWVVIDATWDASLQANFPIEKWDGKNSTKILVPYYEICSPEKSNEIMSDVSSEAFDKDIAESGKFYEAFNNWLVELRQKY